MIHIKCSKCRREIFIYKKIGKGRIWHCWKDRIKEDNSVRDGHIIKCSCGNTIGVDEGKWIKMKPHAFNYSGTITRK
ncbi:hypothetical protein EH221_03205 [bacterium]|nr:MAG: hypothetical protein EH221_03205 [bacterium]